MQCLKIDERRECGAGNVKAGFSLIENETMPRSGSDGKNGSDKNADMLNIETPFLHILKFEQRRNMVKKQAMSHDSLCHCSSLA